MKNIRLHQWRYLRRRGLIWETNAQSFYECMEKYVKSILLLSENYGSFHAESANGPCRIIFYFRKTCHVINTILLKKSRDFNSNWVNFRIKTGLIIKMHLCYRSKFYPAEWLFSLLFDKSFLSFLTSRICSFY